MKINKFIFTFILGFLALHLTAQETKFYSIDSIKFKGLTYYNPNSVRAYIGLKSGDIIEVPGTVIADAIKKLWQTKEFEKIDAYIEPVTENKVNLIFVVKEVPQLSGVKITGVSRTKARNFIKELKLDSGTFHVNNDLLKHIEKYLKQHYIDKGYLNVKVTEKVIPDTIPGKAKVVAHIDKGKRVKIDFIRFHGNKAIKSYRLRAKMKNTKRINPFRFWKSSKFIRDKYEEDKHLLQEFYQSKGFRNATITRDSVYFTGPNRMGIDIWLNEGKKYYFGNIKFVGNAVYSDKVLRSILSIKKGDVYNGKLLKERIANPKKPDAIDLTNLYQNNGYLFSRITPVETGIRGDSIDFEIRIYEGKIAYFNNITIKGNDRTKDWVIQRELRTLPGSKYNKDLIVKTVRELGALQLFNAENIKPKFKNVDPNNGLVDIEWNVEEGGASQIQLQGGYGGKTFIGTLSLSLNNFALDDIFKKKAWKPLPMGDGQRLSIGMNVSFLFESYNFSFTEPWLGGKKPQSLTVSFYRSRLFLPKNGSYYERDPHKIFNITNLSVGLSKRLKWPDDNFYLSQSVNLQNYRLQNYFGGYGAYSSQLFGFRNGYTNNFHYDIIFGRSSSGPNPYFPLTGSDFSILVRMTPPYSFFTGINYKHLAEFPEYQDENGQPDYEKINQTKYRWLEYYKIKFTGDWYTNLYDKLVLRTKTEFGMLGRYNKDLDISPFERFYVGGSGMVTGGYDSRDIIPLRGYNDYDLNRQAYSQGYQGGIVYNKFMAELRYPLSLKPQAVIYLETFASAANTYSDWKKYNPFRLKRSAGIGMRVFMPMFGLLGIDFGYGFDPVYINGRLVKQGWLTSFTIGRSF